MKRDMDLVRMIVFAIESHEHGSMDKMVVIDGYSEEQVGYHAHLMEQAGLIDGFDTSSREVDSPTVQPTSLTWAGHEFADNARSETTWNKARTTIAATVGTVAFGVLAELLKKLAGQQLGL
jgi:hypothetical protein